MPHPLASSFPLTPGGHTHRVLAPSGARNLDPRPRYAISAPVLDPPPLPRGSAYGVLARVPGGSVPASADLPSTANDQTLDIYPRDTPANTCFLFHGRCTAFGRLSRRFRLWGPWPVVQRRHIRRAVLPWQHPPLFMSTSFGSARPHRPRRARAWTASTSATHPSRGCIQNSVARVLVSRSYSLPALLHLHLDAAIASVKSHQPRGPFLHVAAWSMILPLPRRAASDATEPSTAGYPSVRARLRQARSPRPSSGLPLLVPGRFRRRAYHTRGCALLLPHAAHFNCTRGIPHPLHCNVGRPRLFTVPAGWLAGSCVHMLRACMAWMGAGKKSQEQANNEDSQSPLLLAHPSILGPLACATFLRGCRRASSASTVHHEASLVSDPRFSLLTVPEPRDVFAPARPACPAWLRSWVEVSGMLCVSGHLFLDTGLT